MQVLNLRTQWNGNTLSECMDEWNNRPDLSKNLPLLVCWHIWLDRNKLLFEGKNPTTRVTAHKAMGALGNVSMIEKEQNLRVNSINRINGCSVAFFDGASEAGGSNCGAGGVIKSCSSMEYRWYLNCGAGTNTKAELMGAWAALFIAKHLDILDIQLLGDSKVIIDWLKKKANLRAINIEGWKNKTSELASSFRVIHFQHIYREKNVEADLLSKKALTTVSGRLFYHSWDGASAGNVQHFDIF
jgi:ribonuclease HI